LASIFDIDTYIKINHSIPDSDILLQHVFHLCWMLVIAISSVVFC